MTDKEFQSCFGKRGLAPLNSDLLRTMVAGFLQPLHLCSFACFSGLYYRVEQDPLWRVSRPRRPLRQLRARGREADGVRGQQDRLERHDPRGKGSQQQQDHSHRPSVDGHDVRPGKRGKGNVRRTSRKNMTV
jgi:hypothetical protein